MPSKEREQERKAVVMNGDTVHNADGYGSGDAKVAQTGPVKRRKRESASAALRTKRMKDPSREKKGVRVAETTKMTGFDEPTREKVFVTTGGLKRSLFGLRLSTR